MKPWLTVGTLLLVITAGCATGARNTRAGKGPDSNDFEMVVKVDRQSNRVNVTLRSHASRTMCVRHDEWPNEKGELDFAGERVYLTVNGRKCFASNKNLGLCAKDCQWKIKEGGELHGFIALSEFQCEIGPDDEALLTFPVVPEWC
jgi:hypothetical protein